MRKKPNKINKNRIIVIAFVVFMLVVTAIRIINYTSWGSAIKMSDKGYTHAEQFENCTVLDGVDISEYQGDDIKFRKLKASGADFVFVRAGYRGASEGNLNTDACFSRNVREAHKAGLMVGAYYYSQATTTAEAEEEAQALLEIADGYDFELPLVIDYEIYPGGRLEEVINSGTMNVASMYHDIVLAFCRKIEEAGYDSGIYANTDMLTHYMDASVIDETTNLWVAEFAKSCSLNAGYTFWQCSDKASAGGTSKIIDHDFMYIDPHGVTKVWYVNPGNRVSMKDCRITLKKDTVKYKRSGARAKVAVSDAEGKRMREGKDYTLSFVKNMKRGTAYVIVKGINGYRDIIAAEYTID